MTRLRVAWALLIAVAGCTTEVSPTAPAVVPSPPTSPVLVSNSSPSVVPWSSATPLPYVTQAPTQPPDVSACRADQVSAGVAGWGGATGSMPGGFLIWNTSAEPCRLTGRPSVAILDRAGHRLKVTDVRAPTPTVRPIVLPADQAAPVLHEEAPGGLGAVMVQWFNWCGVPPIEPLSLVITLPTGGVLHTPVVVGGSPRCDAPSARSTLSVGGFEVTPGPSPSDPPPVAAEGLNVTLDVPVQATAGQTLHYVVSLSNPSATSIALDPCPAYMERINTVGGPVVADYLLDCAAVPTIAPGATVLFAMELDIPASLPASDDAALVWTLDPYYSEGFAPRPPEMKVPIRIIAP